MKVAVELNDVLANAETVHTHYAKHAAAVMNLKVAFAVKERGKLRDALEEVRSLDIQIEAVQDAKRAYKELDLIHRAEKRAALEADEISASFDAEIAARRAREEYAREARFELANYPGLRLVEDYTQGLFFGKTKVSVVVVVVVIL